MVQSLTTAYEQQAIEQVRIDCETADLSTRYQKLLVLVDQLVLNCHKTERQRTYYKSLYENLSEDVSLYLPKFQEYRFNDKIRTQFASFIDLKTENSEFTHEQKLQQLRFPDEICILKDLERISSVLLSKSEIEMQRDQLIEKVKIITSSQNAQGLYYDSLTEKLRGLQQMNMNLTQLLTKERVTLQLAIESMSHEKQQYFIQLNKKNNVQDELEPKYVQTEFNLVEQYFMDMMDNIGKYDENTVPQLLHYQLTESAEEAYRDQKNSPRLQNKFKQVQYILNLIRQGKSEAKPRKLEKTLMFLQDQLSSYLENQSNQRLDDFIHSQMLSMYGMLSIANRYCESWLMSIKVHQQSDDRVNLFARFLGLDSTTLHLPFSMFRYYIHLLKELSFDVKTLFKNERKLLKIPYMRVLKALKRQLTEDLDPFTKNTVYINISKALTVDCATPHIKRAVENDVTVYETYYDYQQLLTNNKKYPSVAFLLNAIFMAQDMIQPDEDDQLFNLKIGRQTHNDVKQNKKEKNTKKIPEFKKLSKQSEAMFGTEVVTFAHLYNFILKELKPNGDEVEPIEAGYFGNLDYKKMLKALFKVSSSPLPDEKIWISRQDAARYLSERINVSLDLTKVLEIGMNAQIDFENGENVWFEKVFYFYNKIEVIKNEDFAEPDQLLKFKEQIDEGMDVIQFYIFMKDQDVAPFSGNKVECYQLYEAQCIQHNHKKLKCNDFIDLIKQYASIRHQKQYMEAQIDRRHYQILKCNGSYQQMLVEYDGRIPSRTQMNQSARTQLDKSARTQVQGSARVQMEKQTRVQASKPGVIYQSDASSPVLNNSKLEVLETVEEVKESIQAHNTIDIQIKNAQEKNKIEPAQISEKVPGAIEEDQAQEDFDKASEVAEQTEEYADEASHQSKSDQELLDAFQEFD